MAENNIEEIDLVKISSFISKIFAKLFGLLKLIISLLLKLLLEVFFFLQRFTKTIFRKAIIPVSIAAILGAVIGGGYAYVTSPVYVATLMGISSISNFDEVKPRLNRIKELVDEANFSTLASILPLDTVKLSKIKNVDFKYYGKKSPTQIFVTIKCKDFKLYDTLNKIIPAMIKNNEFLKLKTQIALDTKKSLRDRIAKEIGVLDSLKFRIMEIPDMQSSGNKSFIYSINPTAINESIIKFYERQLDLENFDKISPDFYVLEPFTPLKITKEDHYIDNVIFYSSTGAEIMFGIVLLLHMINYLPKEDEKKKYLDLFKL